MNEANEIEILLVEDNQDDLDMTLCALRKANLAKLVNFEGFAAAVQELGMYWPLLNQPPMMKE